MLENLKFNLETNRYVCPHCGKEYSKMGIGTHIWRNHTEKGKEFNPNKGFQDGTRTTWNKGLTAETDERIKKRVEALKEKIESGELVYTGHPHTEESKKRLSEYAHKRNLGGWCSSKKFVYNGVTLQSTYEVEFAKNLDKNNIKWNRPKPFYYVLNGIKHRYYPDFYIEDLDVYVDPKNDFLIERVNPYLGITDMEKIQLVEQQNNVKVIILNKNELTYNDLLNKLKIE